MALTVIEKILQEANIPKRIELSEVK